MKLSALLSVSALVLVGCGGGETTPAPVAPSSGHTSAVGVTATTAATEKIQALSADAIRGLTEGRALRFGRAAEKNHNPSPYFLLKYRSELALFDEQAAAGSAEGTEHGQPDGDPAEQSATSKGQEGRATPEGRRRGPFAS